MEVRCGHCNKKFRVSDDKITGIGIKFKCTKCGEYVKITIEEFQSYKLSSEAASVLDTFAPKPSARPAAPVAPSQKPQQATSEGFAGFDIIEEAKSAAAAARPESESGPSVFAPTHEPDQQPAAAPRADGAPPWNASDVSPAPAVAGLPEHHAPPAGRAAIAAAVPPAFAVQKDTIHPLVSGSAVGATGGIGCAIPSAAMTILGVGALSALTGGKTGEVPIYQAALLSGASLVATGIVIGVILAMFQAKSERNMFGVLGVFLGGLLGAAFGAAQGVIVALGSGAIIGTALIIGSVTGWGIKALLISIAVAIVRKMLLSSRQEAFGTSISGGQMLGVLLSLLLVAGGIYAEISSASKLKTAKDAATKAIRETFSSEGLTITNSLASWDPENGDLVLNVTIENTTEKERPVWYLVADVYDASGKVLIQAKMLSGKQMYTQREYAVLAKRGVNVQEFRVNQLKQKETSIPQKGLVNVELRIMEPPAGVASFAAAFQPFDPVQMLKDQMQEAAKQKQETQ